MIRSEEGSRRMVGVWTEREVRTAEGVNLSTNTEQEEGSDGIGGASGGLNSGTTVVASEVGNSDGCLLYTSPSPRDQRGSRMPSSA